jgi:hypothetical protein
MQSGYYSPPRPAVVTLVAEKTGMEDLANGEMGESQVEIDANQGY